MKMIAGLGNPGKKYEKTRHNAGFLAVDFLASKYGSNWNLQKKFQALTSEANGDLLIKPLTYMNKSGLSLSLAMSYYKLLPRKWGMVKKDSDLSQTLIVIHDDKDLPLGRYKVSTDSGSAGHRGVNSIIEHLKTKNFKRIRIGVATEQKKDLDTANFVLQNFSSQELKTLQEVIKNIYNTEEIV